MSKDPKLWISWIVLAVAIIFALFFVDYSEVSFRNSPVGKLIKIQTDNLNVDDADDDSQYDVDLGDFENDQFL